MRKTTKRILLTLACFSPLMSSSAAVTADTELRTGAGPDSIFLGPPPPIQLHIDSLVINPIDVSNGTCVQVGIYARDATSRDLLGLTFTVELGGDTSVLVGGATANVLVANAFASGDRSGITNPGSVLANNTSGTPVPSCTLIFNRVTTGMGSSVDFAAGAENGTWMINNNLGGVGRKRATVANLSAQTIASTSTSQDMLLGVLVLPFVVNPGVSRLTITATPNATVADSNRFSWVFGGMPASQQLDLRWASAAVRLARPLFVDGFESGDLSRWSDVKN